MEIYVHIPFCVQKCLYCDFFSRTSDESVKDRYFRDLEEEIREDGRTGSYVSSVFFGGGTPSCVPEERIIEILDLLKEKYRVDPEAEITLEANPGTLTKKKLKLYQEAGISRLSLGLQSADDKVLKKLGRIHDFAAFEESFRLAREAGFTNINVDLISGIPGQDAKSFEKSMKRVLKLGPEHLSVYSLIIAENTPFYALYGPEGSLKETLPSEEEDREQVEMTRALMKAYGYRQYEISNYARPGAECRHNIGYWTQEEYIGFGAAAASFYYTDPEKTKAERVKHAESMDWRKLPPEEKEELSLSGLMAEYMILGLRMNEGVTGTKFKEMFGREMKDEYSHILDRYETYGVVKQEGDRIFLTDYGQDVCNLLFEEFL